ncbi:hypothetical protein SARC_11632, partial [Sphaeroforma arctica JP610]
TSPTSAAGAVHDCSPVRYTVSAYVFVPCPTHICQTPIYLPLLVYITSLSTYGGLNRLSRPFCVRSTPSSAAAGDRLGRLTNHLLEQRSFYPLYPAANGVSIDYERLEQLEMPMTPDILLIPSNMKYFAKNVSECLAINPGRLTRAKSGGTYTKFTVHAIRRNDILESETDKPIRHNVINRTRVEILKI